MRPFESMGLTPHPSTTPTCGHCTRTRPCVQVQQAVLPHDASCEEFDAQEVAQLKDLTFLSWCGWRAATRGGGMEAGPTNGWHMGEKGGPPHRPSSPSSLLSPAPGCAQVRGQGAAGGRRALRAAAQPRAALDRGARAHALR